MGSCHCSSRGARRIRKGELGEPNEFAYVSQLAAVTEHTKPGARGVDPARDYPAREPERERAAVAELERLKISTREVAVGGGFMIGPTNTARVDLIPKTVFIARRQEPASKRTTRRWRARTGEEGRVSHLKRRYS